MFRAMIRVLIFLMLERLLPPAIFLPPQDADDERTSVLRCLYEMPPLRRLAEMAAAPLPLTRGRESLFRAAAVFSFERSLMLFTGLRYFSCF